MTYLDEGQEIVTGSERIAQLEDELERYKAGGEPSKMLMEIVKNPGKLQQQFNLTEKQATNVVALITGSGAALSSKYLSQALGNEIAGAIGGFLAGHVAKKLFKG